MTITTRLKPLYEVKLIADGKSHNYQIGNDPTWHPGVTSALKMIDKPALIPWVARTVSENIQEAWLDLGENYGDPITESMIKKICEEGKNIYKKKASDAASIGTRVHGAVNDIIHDRNPDMTPDIKAGVEGFLAWKETNKLTIELGDTRLGSKLFGYGGSLDFVAFDGNEAVIWDLKTTKKRKDRDHGIYPEYCYQLAAYSQAFRETFGIEVKAIYALWVNKEKAEFKAVKISNTNICFEAFLAALKLYKLSKYEMMEA